LVFVQPPAYCGTNQSAANIYQTGRDELWLCAIELPEAVVLGAEYDVRLWLQVDHLFVELNAHPGSIVTDLSSLFAWMRSEAVIRIVDDDEEPSGW